MPALLTYTSTPPRRSASASTAGATVAASPTSRYATCARTPFAEISAAVRAAASSSANHVMPTSSPAAARATATARPMPDSAPVTMARRERAGEGSWSAVTPRTYDPPLGGDGALTSCPGSDRYRTGIGGYGAVTPGRRFGCGVHGTMPRATMAADESRSEEHTSELQSLMRTTYAVI